MKTTSGLDYIEVILDRSEENISSFLSKHLIKSVPASERIRIMKLMEMERNCLLTFTSCGWFFDEISGIESVQVMYYAARTTQLAKDISGADLEPEFMKILGKAPSNIPEFGNGAKVYEVLVKPNVLDILRVGAHYAVSSLFEEYPKHVKLYAFTAGAEHFERVEQGRQKLAVGKAKVRSEITKEEETLSFAVVHFGDHNIHGGIKVSLKDENISKTAKEMKSAFKKEDIPAVMRLMKENFGSHNYSLWHLFKDEQRNVLGQILEKTLAGVEVSFREVYENNFAIMHVLRETGIPLPKAFFITLELILNLDLKREIMARDIDLERLGRVVSDIQKWAVDTDKNILSFVATERISGLMETLLKNPGDTQLASTIDGFIKVLGPLGLELNLWKAQNIYFKLQTGLYPSMADKGEKGDRAAASWTENFRKLGDCLYMNCEG